jgi:DNA-binding transcriptional MerR regulator
MASARWRFGRFSAIVGCIRVQVMPRPRLDRQHEGLTRSEVAAQLRCSASNVRRLQRAGLLPQHKDRSGIYRFQPHDVAEVARKLKRVVRTDGETAGTIYGYFLAPEFRATPKQLARIVHETRQHPDVVLALWEKFKAGAGSPATADADIARVAREYDEQIAAMDEELARKRRVAFIPGDPRNGTASSRASRG